MIADIQVQEVLVVSPVQEVQFAIVQDVELLHVGGGSSFVSF